MEVNRFIGKKIENMDIIGCCLPIEKLCIWREYPIERKDCRCNICPYLVSASRISIKLNGLRERTKEIGFRSSI